MYHELEHSSNAARDGRARPSDLEQPTWERATRVHPTHPEPLGGAREDFQSLLAAETVRHALQRPGPLPPLVHQRARAYARAQRAAGTPIERVVVDLKHLIEEAGIDAGRTHSGSAHAEQLFRWCLGAYFSDG